MSLLIKMDEHNSLYGSTVELLPADDINNNGVKSYRYYPQKGSSNSERIIITSEGLNKKHAAKSSSAVSVCELLKIIYHLLTFLMLVSIIVIATIYIGHLQDHVQLLDSKVDSLQKQVAELRSTQCNPNSQQQQDGMKRSREKRQTLVAHTMLNETHIRQEHHGIGEQNIAYIFANSSKVRESTEGWKLGFAKHIRSRIRGCTAGTIMKNNRGSIWWCNKPHPGQRQEVLLAKNNHKFKFYSQAQWMKEEKFVLHADGSLEVKQAGIYLVHSNIHFTDKSDSPHYGVYKQPIQGEKVLLSKCQVSVFDDEGAGVYPCPSFQLVPLRAQDKIFMYISGYNWFRVEKETMHLALIKLNDWAPSTN